VRQVLEDDTYLTTARHLQRAYARRDGIAEIADLVDEVIAERSVEARHA
jgi:UDP:flavonoid glycosyltransferase YjiC (YdhE family)